MRRVTEAMTVAATAAALVGCGFYGGQENQTSPNNPELEQIFEDTKAYWLDIGIGAVANTKLVTLREPGDHYNCNDNEDEYDRLKKLTLREDSSTYVAMTCSDAGDKDTIVIIESSFKSEANDMAEEGLPTAAFGSYILSHEFGHVVTRAMSGTAPDQRTSEFRADCASGSALSGMGITEVPAILASEALRDHSHKDATGEEQAAAFSTGVADPSGQLCSFYYDPSDLQ